MIGKILILATIFVFAFFLGFRHGSKFIWKKLLNYLRRHGKTDAEIYEIFVELSKSKYL